MIKKELGITLVSLVITVIILLIIAAVTIPSLLSNLNGSADGVRVSELSIVQETVLDQYTKYLATKNSSMLVGEILSSVEVSNLQTELGIAFVDTGDIYNANFYRLNKQDLSKIGVTGAYEDIVYVVNYVTGEVINETVKWTSDNKPLYLPGRTEFNHQTIL